jgi:hypothetical protein
MKTALLLVVSALALLTGCENVKPWQRGTLADPAMNSGERNRANIALNEHVWFSREAATGGRGVAGGGCGCN